MQDGALNPRNAVFPLCSRPPVIERTLILLGLEARAPVQAAAPQRTGSLVQALDDG